MTPEKLENLAMEYAQYVCRDIPDDVQRKEDENVEYDFALPIISWLSDNHYIIPKSEVAKWKDIIDNALKTDGAINKPAMRYFWSKLFNESEE